ncbi:unnamed protein product [Durusdinium trenchii]|uniref:Macro domain-containing protein n=1 Tax=Durusdinium trenchii TaxID=1381693 RepID=A0ABP0H8Y9_9DINO
MLPSPKAEKRSLPKEEHGVTVQETYTVTIPVKTASTSARVCISKGSVVDFDGDAIVNAANRGGLGGGGVDGAVNSRGGPELQEARRQLPVLNEYGDRIPTGEAKITVGGALPAKWVIHAVGPIYWEAEGDDFSKSDMLLAKAYASSLQVAQQKDLKSLGFALLSAGIFRGERPLANIMEIACQAVKDNVYEGLEDVHLIAFTEAEEEELKLAAKRVFTSRGGTLAAGSSCCGLLCRSG